MLTQTCRLFSTVSELMGVNKQERSAPNQRGSRPGAAFRREGGVGLEKPSDHGQTLSVGDSAMLL